MTHIAAVSVQTVTRPAAASAAAPVVAQAVEDTKKAPSQAAKDLAPAVPLVAQDALAALIQAQANHGAAEPQPDHGRDDDHGHTDPQPGHGHDDDHGHHPPPTPPPPPPVVQPPVVQPPPPPVVQPPITPTPVIQPPAPQFPLVSDPAAPARAIALVDRVLSEGRVAGAERSAFAAAAAQRRAAATMLQGHAALGILSAVQTDMAGYRAQALGRYETARRLG